MSDRRSHTNLGGVGATQNQGNVLGSRPCVRQSKVYRTHCSGNAMKAMLGQENLSWSLDQQQGAYAHLKAYDHNQEHTRAVHTQHGQFQSQPQQQQQAAAPTSYQQHARSHHGSGAAGAAASSAQFAQCGNNADGMNGNYNNNNVAARASQQQQQQQQQNQFLAPAPFQAPQPAARAAPPPSQPHSIRRRGAPPQSQFSLGNMQ